MSRNTGKIKLTLLFALCAALTACGGGGESGAVQIKQAVTTPGTDIGRYAANPAVQAGVRSTYTWAGSALRDYICATIPNPDLATWGPGTFDRTTARKYFGGDDVIVTLSEHALRNIEDPTRVAFRNNISGDGGLVLKTIDDVGVLGNDENRVAYGHADGIYDAGLFLTGRNTYRGNTTVESGILVVTRELLGSPLITVKEHGVFAAAGMDLDRLPADGGRNRDWDGIIPSTGEPVKVRGNIVNFGRVTATYTGLELDGGIKNMTPEAVIGVSLEAMIHATGSIDFNHGKLVISVDDYPLVHNLIPEKQLTTRTVVKADGGVENWTGGPAGSVGANWVDNADDYLDLIAVDWKDATHKEITATYRRKSSADMAASLGYETAGVAVTGENLDRIFDELAEYPRLGALQQSAGDILYTPAALLPQTWDSLSGEIYASLQNVTFKQAKILNKTLSDRLHAIVDGNTVQEAGLWVEGVGNKGKIIEKGWAQGKTEVWGGQAGMDVALSPKLILGSALTAARVTAKFSRYAGEAISDQVTLSAYGTYRFGKRWYALGRIGVGFADVDVRRSVFVNPDWHPLKSGRKDSIYSAYVELGCQLHVAENFKLTPYAGFSHDAVKRGSFMEEGHAFGLRGEAETFSQSSAVLGLRAQKVLRAVTLNGHAAHYMALNDEDLSFKATLPADAMGTRWDIKGAGLPRNTTWIGVGVEADVTPKLAVNAGFDLSFERNKVADNVFSVGFRYKL